MGHFLATTLLLASLAPATTPAESPWNGTWLLDVGRSTPGIKDQAAEGYRFTLQPDGQIKWEIPSLGEVVTGKTDGVPMEIHRTKPSPGLTLKCDGGGARGAHLQGRSQWQTPRGRSDDLGRERQGLGRYLVAGRSTAIRGRSHIREAVKPTLLL